MTLHGAHYAQTLVSESKRTIAVRLNQTAKHNDLLLKYQVWHEAIHCLAPTESMETIWFEEGLAVQSAMRAPFVGRKFRQACKADIRRTSWYAPWKAFIGLEASDEQIRAVHEQCPERKFDKVTTDLIKAVFGAPDNVADALCKRMGKSRVT